jgi:integrase
MIQISVRYVVEDIDRHGNVRLYFRRKGCRKVRMKARRDTPEFFEEYQRLLAQSNAGKLKIEPRDAPKVETLRWLCDKYLESTAFTGLDASTQRVRRQIVDHICAEPISLGSELTFRDCPLSRFGAKAVTILRDRKREAPESANARVKVIRVLFRWALDPSNQIEMRGVSTNPARDVPFLQPKRLGGFPPWTIAEVEKFEKFHPIGSKPRLALALILGTGARRSDATILGKQHAYKGPDGPRLRFTAYKGRNRSPVVVDIPYLTALQDLVAASRTGDLTFLVTASGRQFTRDYFGNWFRHQCRLAGVPKSAHGLRKVAAEWAAENGGTTQELMAIFGWKDMKQAERYTRGADRKRLTAKAPALLARPEREQECPTSDRRCSGVGQTGAKK